MPKVVILLKFVTPSEQEPSHFHFAQGPTNCVARLAGSQSSSCAYPSEGWFSRSGLGSVTQGLMAALPLTFMNWIEEAGKHTLRGRADGLGVVSPIRGDVGYTQRVLQFLKGGEGGGGGRGQIGSALGRNFEQREKLASLQTYSSSWGLRAWFPLGAGPSLPRSDLVEGHA